MEIKKNKKNKKKASGDFDLFMGCLFLAVSIGMFFTFSDFFKKYAFSIPMFILAWLYLIRGFKT